MKPGQEKPIRKIGYAVAVPGFDMYLGTGAYLEDLDAKLRPICWLLGLAMLGIVIVSGASPGSSAAASAARWICSAPA